MKSCHLLIREWQGIILLFICIDTSAQNLNISGKVHDSLTKMALIDASVSLSKVHDSLLILFRRNTQMGFEFRNLKPGNYLIVASFLGYKNDSVIVSLKSESKNDLDIRLSSKTQILNEVLVRGTIPSIDIKHDTIVFNTASYSTPPYATLEDLLKKLPGVAVDQNGDVTLNGKKVDKILIDGKEFFLSDLKKAIRILPSSIAGQIELFDTQSEQARLSGIRENSSTKTLNIKLKEEQNGSVFGKVFGGLGNRDSYSSGAEITRISSPLWFVADMNGNNINNQFIGIESQTGGGNGVQSYLQGGANFRNDWSKKMATTINFGTVNSKNTLIQTTDRQTTLVDSSLLENRVSSNQLNAGNIKTNLFSQYTIDSSMLINLRMNWTQNRTGNHSEDTVALNNQKGSSISPNSEGLTKNATYTNNNNFSNNLDFQKQFGKKGRTLYIGLTESFNIQNQTANLYSKIDVTDGGTSIQNQQSGQATNNNSYGLHVTYTEPFSNGHLFDLDYSFNETTNHSDKQTCNFDSLTDKYDDPDSLYSNNFRYTNTMHRISAGYNKTEGKFRFQVGLTGQLTTMDNQNLTNGAILRQNFLNWFPKTSVLWQLSKNKNLNLSYGGTTTLPTIDQLQPDPDPTNPYLVKTGNPYLKEQLNHSVSGGYSSFSQSSFQNLQASIAINYSEHQITTASTVLPGGLQQVGYINVEGVYHISSNIAFSLPLRSKNANISFISNSNYGHDISFINGVANSNNNIALAGSVLVNYHLATKLFVDARISVSSSHAYYLATGSQSTSTLACNLHFNINYQLPAHFTITTNYMMQFNGSQGTIPASYVPIWNASIYKQILRNRQARLMLSAFDLPNSENDFSQSTGINYVQTQKSNLPGRLLLLSFIYNFKKS